MRILVTWCWIYWQPYVPRVVAYGYKVSVIDSLYNGSIEAVTNSLSNCTLNFNQCDVRDAKALDNIFDSSNPMRLFISGLKAVGESVLSL